MRQAVCLGLILPLLGFLTLLVSSSRIERRSAGWLACGSVALSLICFASVLLGYMQEGMSPQNYYLFNWISLKGIEANFTLHLDSLSILMALIITGVGLLIHIYSIGYMDHEEDFARYFACLNFFIFAILLLVLAGDLLLLFIGWEAVGLASYLLIGFWYRRPSAAQAASKAFIINRIGDLGLLLGLLLTWHLFGTTDIETISQLAGQDFTVGAPVLTALTLLFFWGATGKSAQLPLYTWLPDAMEGPTPVSALIHAATMVTVGIYLVVRLHILFNLAPITLAVIGIVGGLTALFAALSALAQNDLKRVLAYSTISQLGLMFLACGVGAYYAAMFHLTTHAFIKALLFLSAGNVVHMMHDTTNMEKMGGLSKKLTKTHWLFLIGTLALAGVPPFAAFFSKDLILELEHLRGSDILFFIGLAASILTAVYLTRAYCLTFTGKPRSSEETLSTVKEAPAIMLVPAAILALLAMTGGFLGFAFSSIPPLEYFLSDVGVTANERELSTGLHLSPQVWMAMAGSILGVGLTALLYTRFYRRLGQPIVLLKNAFYIDYGYHKWIACPLKSLAKSIADFFEPKVFENSLHAAGQAAQEIAGRMQRIQNGHIRTYIALMFTGTAFLIVYFIVEGFHA